MILKMFSRYRRHERSLKELIIWIIGWSAIGFFAFFPTIIDTFSEALGVKNGAIGFLALWLIFLTYGFFRTFTVVEGIDKRITDLTRRVALDDSGLKKTPKNKKK